MIDFLQTHLLTTGLSNAATALGFAICVFLVTWKSKLPLWTHALWVLVLVKLVTPPLLWIPTVLPDIGVSDQARPVPVVSGLAVGSPSEPDLFPGRRVAETTMSAQQNSPIAKSASPWFMKIAWLQVVFFGWLLGSLIVAVKNGVNWFRFRRWLRQSSLATGNIQDEVVTVAGRIGLKSVPKVRIVAGVMAPSIYSVAGQSTLLLPAGLLNQLDAQELQTVIAHELAHLRRRDHWVRLLEMATAILFWWHPVVPIARKKNPSIGRRSVRPDRSNSDA